MLAGREVYDRYAAPGAADDVLARREAMREYVKQWPEGPFPPDPDRSLMGWAEIIMGKRP